MAISFSSSLDAIKAALPAKLQSPHVGIICGSGLSGIVDIFRDVVLVPYENIPGFSKSTGEADGPARVVKLTGFQYLGIKARWRSVFWAAERVCPWWPCWEGYEPTLCCDF